MEWTLLEPMARYEPYPQLTLTSEHATINAAAQRVIDIANGGPIELAVRTDGTVSIRPARPGVSPVVRMSPHGKFSALPRWAREYGYAPGKYRLEERDGALWCRLRKGSSDA